MAKTETKTSSEGKVQLLKYVKSLFVALIITFACIIIFAFVIKWANLSDDLIGPVNLCIKAISVFFGALVLAKGSAKGLFNGILFALVYTLISFVIFSLLAGGFVLGLGLVSDFAFNAIAGAIGGAVGVNIKK